MDTLEVLAQNITKEDLCSCLEGTTSIKATSLNSHLESKRPKLSDSVGTFKETLIRDEFIPPTKEELCFYD